VRRDRIPSLLIAKKKSIKINHFAKQRELITQSPITIKFKDASIALIEIAREKIA
jgi:hypothetical protein